MEQCDTSRKSHCYFSNLLTKSTNRQPILVGGRVKELRTRKAVIWVCVFLFFLIPGIPFRDLKGNLLLSTPHPAVSISGSAYAGQIWALMTANLPEVVQPRQQSRQDQLLLPYGRKQLFQLLSGPRCVRQATSPLRGTSATRQLIASIAVEAWCWVLRKGSFGDSLV